MAIEHGASAIGLVSEMPSGPGPISEDLIATIAATIPPAIGSFLLTCKQDVSLIIDQQKHLGVNTISLVQVIHVTGIESIEEALRVAPDVDGILLDSGNQSLPVKELGGTGRTHDWNLSRQIRESVVVPVFLAGGLKSENVAEAIRQVGPFAVDVCSGLRTSGLLDETKLKDFFAGMAAV